MDITLEKKSRTEGAIKISLNEGDYQSQVAEKIKDYSKKANIKGFRQGKVPTSYIKKLYGKSILVEEINQLLSKSLTDYIKENKINILGEPLPNDKEAGKIDWDSQKDFDFEYAIGMVDEFEYDLSKKVKVTSYKIKVDDAAINETVENLTSQYGNMTNPEVSEKDDAIYGNLSQGEFSKDLLLETKDMDKKIEKKFMGLKKDDVVTFDLHKAFPDTQQLSQILGVSEEETKAISGDVEFKTININRCEKAELNQEFFDKIFGPETVKSEEAFLEKIKTTIEENYEKETMAFLDYSIQKEFVDKTKIELPDEFLKRWLIASNEGKITEEDIKNEYDAYIKDLKWSLIKSKIAEDNELKTEHEDVMEKARELIRENLAQSGMGSQFESNIDAFVDNYLKGDEGNNYYKVFNQAHAEKIMGKIKETISIGNKEVDVEKFKKLVSS